MDGPVECHFGEIETDDSVVGVHGVAAHGVEHSRDDPFIAARSPCRIGHLVLEDRLDTRPRTAGAQTDENPPEAQPVRDPRPVTTQGVVLGHRRDQGLDDRPDGIYHFGFECAHDVGDLHLVVGWDAPRIKSGPSQRPVDGHLSARPLKDTAFAPPAAVVLLPSFRCRSTSRRAILPNPPRWGRMWGKRWSVGTSGPAAPRSSPPARRPHGDQDDPDRIGGLSGSRLQLVRSGRSANQSPCAIPTRRWSRAVRRGSTRGSVHRWPERAG